MDAFNVRATPYQFEDQKDDFMRRFTFGSLLIPAAAIGVVAGLAGVGPVDYSKLSPTAGELLGKLNQCDITLAEAIKKAEENAGGTASSANFEFSDSGMIYTINVVSNNARHTVVINGANGEITNSTTESGSPIPGWEIEEGIAAQTTDSGVTFYDLEVGDGAAPSGPSSRVTVHYTGYFVNGQKFDSSVDRGQPLTLPLNQFIPGWADGVRTMKVGGKRKVIIPYHLAYGERGRPGIPPRAMLVFDVELVELP